MTPDEFRQALKTAKLSQVSLAELLGVSKKTVNRWCAEADKEFAAPVPLYAVNFVQVFQMLTPEQRQHLWSIQ